jgi:hypothetical protein
MTGTSGEMRIEEVGSCNVTNVRSLWRNEPHWHAVWPEGGTWCYRTPEDAAARAVEVTQIRAPRMTPTDQERIDELRCRLAAAEIKLRAARMALAACEDVRAARREASD